MAYLISNRFSPSERRISKDMIVIEYGILLCNNCIATSHDSEFIIVFREEMNPIRDARQALLATFRRSSLRDTSVSRVLDVGERLL
jgi:hypothetical protein